VTTLWCEQAWLGGAQADAGVLIEVAGGHISHVEPGAEPPPGAQRLPGLTLPGLANAHSHAFQRVLRGRTQAGGPGSFWTWREQMYAAAERLDPDRYRALARATFAEMALAGITLVGEFHYVHHGPDGRPYADPNAMGHAVIEAAREAGVRLTLLDTCYLRGGIAREPDETQRRFSDGDADAWAERVDALRDTEDLRIGTAIHSVRAVDPAGAQAVAAWAAQRGAPLHAHVSEQPAENEECLAAYGVTPTALLAAAGALEQRFTAVHATHLTEEDVELLGGAGATCCFCPTTERDLGDGIGPSGALREAGAALAVGSDSQAAIDLLEEARAIELDERLARRARGIHAPADLLRAATASGYDALGWPGGGRLAEGAPADLAVVALDSVRLAGTPPEHILASVLFAGAAPDVRDVMAAGRWVVRDHAHSSIDVAAELAEVLTA
jgi:formiminoglutamate deiminase